MNREFKALRQGSSREDLLRLFALGYNAVPVIDEHRRPVGLDTPDLIPTANSVTVAARACAPIPICLSADEFASNPDATSEDNMVLDASLACYAYATVLRSETPEIRLLLEDSNQEERYNSLRELLDTPNKSLLCVVASVLRPTFGFSVLVRTDLPGYLAVGSETAIAMSVIAAFNELRAEPWSNYEMVRLAHGVERLSHNLPSERRGDYPFGFGGFNLLESRATRRALNSIRLEADIVNELEANLLLCVIARSATRDDTATRARAASNSALASRMRRHLLRGELADFGACLHEVWGTQRANVDGSSLKLAEIYDAAQQSGALGGKLLDAGALVVFLFFVDPRKRASVSKRLTEHGATCRSVRFDFQGVRSWRTKVA
jgi:D-glycero-alpha-D-manno-heptose-7-phosphate kinase